MPRAELIDVNNGRLTRVCSVAARVAVAVQSRQGAFDHLWITDAEQAREIGAAFTAATRVDARLVANAGAEGIRGSAPPGCTVESPGGRRV